MGHRHGNSKLETLKLETWLADVAVQRLYNCITIPPMLDAFLIPKTVITAKGDSAALECFRSVARGPCRPSVRPAALQAPGAGRGTTTRKPLGRPSGQAGRGTRNDRERCRDRRPIRGRSL